mgnify:CR=1 FL=1
MAQNLVVQLLLKTGTFSNDLKTAKGQIQNFQKGCQTAGDSLSEFGSALGINVGALTKLGGAIGAASLAGKGFKEIIDSNQTSSDTFQATLYSLKTAAGELAYSLATFDFSNFNNGLLDMISRGREAANAIDQLGNTLMSYNIVRAEAELRISKARSVIRNPKSTPDERKAAEKDMENAMSDLRSSTAVLVDDYKNTIISEVRAKGLELSGDDSLSIIDKWLKMDATVGREKAKSVAKEGWDAYQSELKKLNNKEEYLVWKTIGTSNTGYTMGGLTPDTSNPEYQKELRVLQERYKDEIAYNVLLEKYNDTALDQLGQRRIAMLNTEKTLEDLTTSMFKVEKAGKQATETTTKGLEDEIEVMKESLTDWKEIENKALRHRNAEVFNSKSWNNYNDALELAKTKIDEINRKIIMMEKRKAFKEAGTLPKLPPIVGKAEVGQGINLKHTENELVQLINVFSDLRKELKEGDPMISRYNQTIEYLGTRLENIRNQGLPDISNNEKEIDYLSSFSSALMSTTSSVSALSSALIQLIGTEDESLNGFKKLFNTLNVGISIFTSIVGLIQSINTLTEMSGTVAAMASEEKATSATTAAAAVTAEAAATVAAKEAEAKAAGKAAVAKAAESQAGIPGVGPALAVAAAATIVSAILSAMSRFQAQKFANGGIVGGSSFTGDRVSAQVNSGEMILNKTQQANLFKLANGGGTGKEVTFHISGTDLVGVMNNINRKNKVIR